MADTLCGFDSIPGGDSGANLLAFYGPTIMVDIGFDPDFKPVIPLKTPIPGIKNIRALIDTGARESCIDSLLATQLNLPIVDKQTVSGVQGKFDVTMHLAQVHFPSIGFTLWGSFAAVHLAAGGQPHQALIGRTFLQYCTMLYDGKTGTVKLSYP